MGESSIPLPYGKAPSPSRYRLEHAIDVGRNLMIGEAEHCIAKLSQADIATPIGIRVVGIAVDLDHQSDGRAAEIYDARFDDVLKAEL